MEVNEAELDKLMARLLNRDEKVREAARQEIQSWSVETAGAMINFAAKREHEKTVARSSRLRPVVQRLWPTQANARFPNSYDWLVIVHAEQVQDIRFVPAILNVLSRYQGYKRVSLWHAGKEKQDGPSPYWSNGVMMKQARIRIPIDKADLASLRLLERPLTSALLRLLPQIEAQKRVLTADQQQTLLQLLRFPYRDMDLSLCILDFLTLAGNAEAIETLELMERTAIDTANGHRIRAAVNACLAQVRARAKQAFQAQTLLRPVNDDALAAPETLLRPVSDVSADPPDELLRPVEKSG